MMKQEAALRRERALAYAFSHQASFLFELLTFLVIFLLILTYCSFK